MKNLGLIVSAAVTASVVSNAASAADLAGRPYTKAIPMMSPAYDWSGFYVGVNGGYGSSRQCFDRVGFGGVAVTPFPEGCLSATGGVAGGQVGYRWQTSNWVFGFEAKGGWADLHGSSVSAFNNLLTNNSKIDAFGLFTGQLGYAWNNTLLYVKGGAALTDNTYNGINTLSGRLQSMASENRWGGAIGAGLEHGIAPNWSVGVEYDHLFMGARDNQFVQTVGGVTLPNRDERTSQDVDLFTAHVTYHFGVSGPYVGLKYVGNI